MKNLRLLLIVFITISCSDRTDYKQNDKIQNNFKMGILDFFKKDSSKLILQNNLEKRLMILKIKEMAI